MNKLIFVILICILAGSLEAKTKRRGHARKSHARAQSSRAKKRPVAAVSKKGPARKGRAKQPVKVAQTWRNRQQTPSSERYREIQDALVAKGYLNSSPTGVWDQDSAVALRRFQEEQNLEPTGRLNSLSLIALGLGPRTEASARPPTQQSPAQQ
ncbi:MAG: peptidoglycan-binding protein [Acidobacteriota bacterium]|nr:peptidoglycan-binding protein [Acidobacteriota bacterium]